MLSTVNLAEVLWVAAGALLTLPLTVALTLWIAHEPPIPDDTLRGFPVAEPGPDDPGEERPSPARPPFTDGDD